MNKNNTPLLFGYQLNRKGSAKALDSVDPGAWDDAGLTWFHLDVGHPGAQDMLTGAFRLPSAVVQGLAARDTRPRSLPVGKDGLLLILRDINLNKGERPEDMVALRLWLSKRNIVSMRIRRNHTVLELVDSLVKHEGVCDTGEFLIELLDLQLDKIARVVQGIDKDMESLEGDAVEQEDVPQMLKSIRKRSLELRRFLVPQRDVMMRLPELSLDWMTDSLRMQLMELADRTSRYIEDLDFLRERAHLVQEEHIAAGNASVNDKLLVLSLMTSVFLPIGILASILGMNVAGIPFAGERWAFAVTCLAFFTLGVGVIGVFKWRRWF